MLRASFEVRSFSDIHRYPPPSERIPGLKRMMPKNFSKNFKKPIDNRLHIVYNAFTVKRIGKQVNNPLILLVFEQAIRYIQYIISLP